MIAFYVLSLLLSPKNWSSLYMQTFFCRVWVQKRSKSKNSRTERCGSATFCRELRPQPKHRHLGLLRSQTFSRQCITLRLYILCFEDVRTRLYGKFVWGWTPTWIPLRDFRSPDPWATPPNENSRCRHWTQYFKNGLVNLSNLLCDARGDSDELIRFRGSSKVKVVSTSDMVKIHLGLCCHCNTLDDVRLTFWVGFPVCGSAKLWTRWGQKVKFKVMRHWGKGWNEGVGRESRFQWRHQAWARGLSLHKCRLAPTVKHTG